MKILNLKMQDDIDRKKIRTDKMGVECFFTRDTFSNKNPWFCVLCCRAGKICCTQTYNSDTKTNIFNHLVDGHHPTAKQIILQELMSEEKTNQNEWNTFIERMQKRIDTKGDRKGIPKCTYALWTAELIASTGVDFKFVDKPGFRKFIERICPEFIHSDYRTIKTKLEELYDQHRSTWLEKFAHIRHFSLTTDAYAKKTRKGDDLLALNIHYQETVDNKLYKRVKNLEAVPFKDKSKNAITWEENIRASLKRWKISDDNGKIDERLVTTVTDGEAALLKAVREGLKLPPSRCGCHQINGV